MREIILSSVLLLVSLCGQAQQAPEKIDFSKNGEFKIAQFTDMYLGHDQEKNMIVADMIKEILDSKKPDLVAFTGDIIAMDEVSQAWEAVIGELAIRQLPWTAVLGNHDGEYAVKRDEIIRIVQQQPYRMIRNIVEGIKGEDNRIISTYGSADNRKVATPLYCLDTDAYSKLKTVKGYGQIGQSQISWYTRESQRYTEQNGEQPLPTLTSLYISLSECTQTWESSNTKRYGDRNGKECSPSINSGTFTQMLECGDVMGIFAGHNHVNGYIVTLYNIALGYGYASGGKNTYGDEIPGSHMIALKRGEREFNTQPREKGDTEKLDVCIYLNSFVKKK